MVVAAVGLRREACGACPHEAENGIKHAEDGAAQPDGPDVSHRVQVTHQHHVHQTQQGYGDVADDVRNRQL